jgi:hypothetical protein
MKSYINNTEENKLNQQEMVKKYFKQNQTCPAVPKESVNLNASVPYSFMVSRGSMTFPNVLDIFLP